MRNIFREGRNALILAVLRLEADRCIILPRGGQKWQDHQPTVSCGPIITEGRNVEKTHRAPVFWLILATNTNYLSACSGWCQDTHSAVSSTVQALVFLYWSLIHVSPGLSWWDGQQSENKCHLGLSSTWSSLLIGGLIKVKWMHLTHQLFRRKFNVAFACVHTMTLLSADWS